MKTPKNWLPAVLLLSASTVLGGCSIFGGGDDDNNDRKDERSSEISYDKKLGEAPVGTTLDTDTFTVSGNEKYRSVKVSADGGVFIQNITIVYDNDERTTRDVNAMIRDGGRQEIDLSGEQRTIRSVSVLSRAESGNGKVRVYAGK